MFYPKSHPWYWQVRQGRLKHLLFSRLYVDRHRDLNRSVMVAGMARSGTTWLAELIAAQGANRLLFEPFNPWPVGALQSQRYIPYKRVEDDDAKLKAFCGRLFSGDIRHPWIDQQIDCLRPQSRVVKVVRANLMLGWLRRNFPQVPQVLIIRHPCAVVSSWLKLGWSAERDLDSILEQQELLTDYLADKLELAHNLQTPEDRIAFVWGVNHLVPLKQLIDENVHVVFYEKLIAEAESEIPKLFAAIERPYNQSVFLKHLQPSQKSTWRDWDTSGAARIKKWRGTLTPDQQRRIWNIVAAFGLEMIYDESGDL